MRKRNNVKLAAVLVLGDILAINLGFLVAYWLRFRSGLFPIVYGIPHISEYIKLLPVLTVILLFLARAEKLYSAKARLSIVDEFFVIVRSVTLGILVFMAATFVYREYSYSRGMLIVSWLMLIFFMGGWRFFVNRVRILIREKKGKTRNLLIIGDGPMVNRLIMHISGDPHWDYNVKGVVRVNFSVSDYPGDAPVLGSLDNLTKILEDNDIGEVILTDVEMPRSRIMDIIMECEKRMIEFRLVADILGMVTSQVDMQSIDGVPLLGLKDSPLMEGYHRFIKRVTDIVFSSIGLVVLSPVFLVVGAAVKLSSSGPMFYLQKRIGEDGRRFAMIKFRTMVENAEKGVGRVWAQENDPRRTGVGGVLRKYNLDELPQLVNVLKGEMSLVGPRPERPHFVGKFKEDIPRYMTRHKIKSGMTGWAQVNGLRGNTSIEERTKYDLYYIENWSLAFDLKILFMSVFAVKNAY